ncbi:MAG: OsmC family protein [Planctomycetes bacterium]|nr:OsmC family protein [Planctomycetota bacterium]
MEMNIAYTGGMRFDARARNHTIVVDQPKDGGGQDAGPTPPELFVASLGSCVGVYALWFCQKRKIPYEGMKINVNWSKAATPPARVDRIEIKIILPQGCPTEHKAHFIASVEKCLVHNSITQAPEIKITV